DHYNDARRAFEQIRADALKQANGRPVTFVLTGHSLGGGLAMHIAFGFPCVSAVVFNASPVVNRHLYQEPFDGTTILNVVQTCEALGFARHLTGGDAPFPYLRALQNLFGGEYFSPNYHYFNYDTQNKTWQDATMNCIRRTFFYGDTKV